MQAVLRRSATQHWRYSHAKQGSQCTPSPTNDCWNNHLFDVNSRDFGATPRNKNSCSKGLDDRIVSLFHPRSSRVAARNLRPASAIRVLIRRFNIVNPVSHLRDDHDWRSPLLRKVRRRILRLPQSLHGCKDAGHIIRAGHLFASGHVVTICPFRDCLDVAIKLHR